MNRIVLLVGARPNYMKAAPLWREIRERMSETRLTLVHSGQHYDANLSDVFFDDLDMPRPDVSLGVGSGTHAEQTARVMTALEPVLTAEPTDLLIVLGDINSTVAGSLTATKLHIPVAHVEAGLRSRDRSMPEEINRVVTDTISDVLFTTCEDANTNLRQEGIPDERVHFVGNIMIDSLVAMLPKAAASTVLQTFNMKPRGYVAVTLHRPSNVDHPDRLLEIMNALTRIGKDCPVVFPVHPRTRKQLQAAGWQPEHDGVRLCDPLGYLDFLKLMSEAGAVLTDSGGIQEETSFLGIPCLTVRDNTERPITISQGTNRLVPADTATLVTALTAALSATERSRPTLPLWDGKTAGRIVDVLDTRRT
jgi:UDP-N-acetylglucosamine 2-epimerase (non-hydrolysing)